MGLIVTNKPEQQYENRFLRALQASLSDDLREKVLPIAEEKIKPNQVFFHPKTKRYMYLNTTNEKHIQVIQDCKLIPKGDPFETKLQAAVYSDYLNGCECIQR